ncbi:putative Alpha-(1,3)-fucosyltransferase C [Hypsibius exemplaris]|uniref:Fucosyltransferase n=1 Tax=Hypsibius exemplaris TaxID=2072580 RepID=A0A1W0X1M7_HYPEX|nr:putative Alpha-(1,3)-fucosyltransferase C [Hypsibius exemplaris]
MYRLTIRHIHRLVNNAMKQPPRLLCAPPPPLAEVVRPGVLIHPVVWPKTPRQRIGTLQLDNEVVSVVLPLQDDAVAVKSDPVKILFWTQYFSADFEPGDRHNHFGEVHEELDKCPIKNCITFTHDKAQINDSAAVFFHIRDFFPQADRPTVRVPGQYYVFYLLESPLNTHMDLNSMEGFFNLTFTYRRDSDIPASYYHRRFGVNTWTEGDGEFEKLWKGETDFSAIFMSFCGGQSGRNGYLDELGKAMSLDIYGSCGPGVKKCEAMNKTDWHCDEMLSTYKFYLAFENSICRDYMTEKVYRALNHGTIPVVYGGANYKDFLPPTLSLTSSTSRTPRNSPHD